MTNNVVLITRPLADADEFAKDILALGLKPLIEPMLGIVPINYQTPDLGNYSAIAFTSANAVRMFGRPEPAADIQVFAAGQHTAEEARKQGYLKVISAGGDASDLAALIRLKLPAGHGPVLHIRGEHTAMPLEELLRKDKILVTALVVYTAKSEDAFTPTCRDALKSGNIGAVTFFSKRTAANFITLAANEGLTGSLAGIKALCISPSVLECVQGASWAQAYSAERPEKASMLALVRSVCGPSN
jgi:uroporphyrinogen-III synthase